MGYLLADISAELNLSVVTTGFKTCIISRQASLVPYRQEIVEGGDVRLQCHLQRQFSGTSWLS